MQLIEIKNNLVRVNYDATTENLVLSGFVFIKDSAQAFIGQIINLDANTQGNFAVVKLLFNFNTDGVISAYNGSIPDIKGLVDIINPEELLSLFPISSPVVLGELAQQGMFLKLDSSLFEEKLLVCSEREEDKEFFIKTVVPQLINNGKKLLLIDNSGTLARDLDIEEKNIVAGKDFKLPLNYETINFIYEKGLDDAKAETKAMIQEIFLEVQEYVKSLPEKFIPFQTFKNVVDEQYQELELVELVLLKNKLLKFYEEGVFAQEKFEFSILKDALQTNNILVLDLSQTDSIVQREMISYAYSVLKELNQQTYVVTSLENSNSDKKLLKQILTTENVYSTIIAPYSYKYLKELKQLSKNLVLFTPIQQQTDFASYNVFLNKLNNNEFVVYGQTTHHLPLIVKLTNIPPEAFESAAKPEVAQAPAEEIISEQDLLDDEIKRDVDAIYTAPKSESQEAIIQESFSEQEEIVEDELTDEDLDLIDDLNMLEENNAAFEEPIETEELQPAPEAPIEELVEELVEDSKVEQSEPAAPYLEVVSQQPETQQRQSSEDILPAEMSTTPIVPIYSADVEPQANSDAVVQGDTVTHPKYGRGTVEKLINYGSKTLCSINFDNVGRRLLDPALAEIKKAQE